jgi:hypothetical protein
MPNFFEKLLLPTPLEDQPERGTFDPEPSVREPEAGTDFLPPNPDLPAVRQNERDLMDILDSIDRNTRGLDNSEGSVWQHRYMRLPEAAGEFSVENSEPTRYLYIPDVPRTLTVYAGQSKGVYLARLTVGESLNVSLPFNIRGVYVEYDAGGKNQQVNVFFSSKPIEISIHTGGVGRTAVWG